MNAEVMKLVELTSEGWLGKMSWRLVQIMGVHDLVESLLCNSSACISKKMADRPGMESAPDETVYRAGDR